MTIEKTPVFEEDDDLYREHSALFWLDLEPEIEEDATADVLDQMEINRGGGS